MIPDQPAAGCGGADGRPPISSQKDITRYEAGRQGRPQERRRVAQPGRGLREQVSRQRVQGAQLTDTADRHSSSALRWPTARPSSCSPSRRAPRPRQQRLDTLEVLAGVYDSMADYQAETACTASSPALQAEQRGLLLRHGERRHQRRRHEHRAARLPAVPGARSQRPGGARCKSLDQAKRAVTGAHEGDWAMTDTFSVNSERPTTSSVAVITLSGEVDIYTAPRFKERMLELLDAGVDRSGHRPHRGQLHRLHGARRAHRRRAPREQRRRRHGAGRGQPPGAARAVHHRARPRLHHPRHTRGRARRRSPDRGSATSSRRRGFSGGINSPSSGPARPCPFAR